MAKRKLGRGLDVLIAPREEPETQNVLQLDPSQVDPNPYQPRKRFPIGELEELKTSVAKEGILQPILVRQVGDRYQVVAGERRLRAAQDLELKGIPGILVDVPDERLLEMALVENIHREDLNPIELAEAYRQLMEARSWTQDTLAQQLGVGRASVSNTVRLLELSEDMQEALIRGQITVGHAKVLLSVGDEKEQRLLFERIAEENLSVRDLETTRDLDTSPQEPSEKSKRKKKQRPGKKKPYLITLEEELSEALGLRVRIRERGGKGVVAIEFYSQEDFERLRGLLSV